MIKKDINVWQWQNQLGFVQANDITGMQRIIYCSGQVSVDNDGKPLFAGDMKGQINQALNNLEVVLKQAGTNFSHVVRLNYYTTDMVAFRRAEPMLFERLLKSECRPVSTLLGVASLYLPEILVEIEATAVV